MAEQYPQEDHEEAKEGGCFEFMKKKQVNVAQEDVIMTDDTNAAKQGRGEEKRTLMDVLQHAHTHSSSVSCIISILVLLIIHCPHC